MKAAKGFTLIELAVVLALIAVLTHLAVRELGAYRDEKLVTVANRQLEEIRASAQKYLADVGSLVPVTDGTLSALWQRPAAMRPYAVREAVATNLVRALRSQTDLVTEKVYVPTGWRGPYVRLPLGKTRLFDPWGNAYETTDAAGLPRLWVTNGLARAIAHYGPTARKSGLQQLSLEPDGGAEAQLTVSVASTSGADSTYTAIWYGPCEGLITGAVAQVSTQAQARFERLTPGDRVVVIKTSAGVQAIRRVTVRPGDNLIEVNVP